MSNFSPRSMLIQALRAHDAERPRSLQEEIGPSSAFTCAREVWHKFNKTPITNKETNILPALMGTWIHKGIEEAISNKRVDPFGVFLKEIEVRQGDLPGHVDLFIEHYAIVVDWKTSTKKRLKSDNFPDANYIYQAQIYGYLLRKDKGFDVKKVAIVALPRDGGINDIVEFIKDYDEDVALKGIEWIENAKHSKEKPEPTKDAKTYCQFYCDFYDSTATVGCPGTRGRY